MSSDEIRRQALAARLRSRLKTKDVTLNTNKEGAPVLRVGAGTSVQKLADELFGPDSSEMSEATRKARKDWILLADPLSDVREAWKVTVADPKTPDYIRQDADKWIAKGVHPSVFIKYVQVASPRFTELKKP